MSEQQDQDKRRGPRGIQTLTTDDRTTKMRAGTRLRNYFLTGLIVAAPVSITIYITWWFITLIDGWVKPFVPAAYLPETYLPFTVPGVGLLFAIAGLMILGALTANLFGRTVVSYGELMLNRMPIVRNVYRALKQIFETVLSQSHNSFQKAGLIEYPRKGIWSIVFVSTATKGEIVRKSPVDGDMLSVFLPTTPNPTSGFLLFVPKSDVVILDMTVEEAAKMVISAGLVTPGMKDKAAQLAKVAQRRRKMRAAKRSADRAPEQALDKAPDKTPETVS